MHMLKNLKGNINKAWKTITKDFVFPEADRGATFVEIIVTISIIIILATSVGVAVMQYIPRAQQASTKQTIGSIQLALDMYFTENFKYPDTLEEIVKNLNPPNMPKDAWTHEFQYTLNPKEGVPYEIISFGRDGEEGGTGPDADISSLDMNEEKED